MNFLLLMRQFTIRFRMLGAIAVVLGLLGLLGGAGMLGMLRIHSVSGEVMTTAFGTLQKTAALRNDMASIRIHEKEMIIQYEKTEAVKAARARWNDSLQRAEKAAAAVGEAAGADSAAAVKDLAQKLGAYRELFNTLANQIESGGYESATTASRMSARAVAQFDEASKVLDRIEADLQKFIANSVAEEDPVASQTQWFFVAAVALTIVVVVPLTLLNMQSICRPLEEARGMAQAIAGGDLSRHIAAEGRDELADLQRALADMQAGLGSMVAQVRDSSENIATASQEIASGNADLSSRTEQTASNVQETVASIAQLTGNVQQTAQSAQVATQLAATASSAAVRGGTVVGHAVSSMHDISASSRKISDIIGVIDSIAFQTNILALNAAVEAARAGEQGRGFAVVASEVRSLAGRSAQAASEIKVLIKTSVTAVDGGVRQVEDAGAAMQEIVASVQRVTDIIGEISASAAEQSTGIGQVNKAVEDIDRMTQQNAALVEQSAAAAESLREQAGRLETVVHQFKIDDAQAVSHIAAAAPQAAQPTRAGVAGIAGSAAHRRLPG
ncbi:methyl-accepting chemotaxis protein [Ramlibacter sp. H39-3-26]|uniref:methyl-accepting chemotaxis protein n=1 Tax=Curvibacter soli TaxID=3031331 RepID=UPI0023DA3CA3|nr:methyl-accepting chemotaxis protein [Ramlibacter sp. H39-3-26]MDF1485643.1 methyl-accepting chemotaxis protein [Ramlibacter sp. H39-3-26]